MSSVQQDLCRAIVVVTEALEIYYQSIHDKTERPIRLQDFQDIVIQKTELTLKIRLVKWARKFIYGRLMRYSSHAVIDINAELNQCWTRFVAVKELCHLLIDDEKSFVVCAVDLVNDLLLKNTAFKGVFGPIRSEQIAEICACEILMPYTDRKGLSEQLASGNRTAFEIAFQYKMPEVYVSQLLQPSVMQWRDSIEDSIREKLQ